MVFFVSGNTAQSMMYTNNRMHQGDRIAFVCVYISLLHCSIAWK